MMSSKALSRHSPLVVSHRALVPLRAPCPRSSIAQEATTVAEIESLAPAADPVKMAWRADSRAILVRPTNDVTSLSEIIVSSLNRGSRTQLKVTGGGSNYTALKGIALATSEALKRQDCIAAARPSMGSKPLPDLMAADGFQAAPFNLYLNKLPSRELDGSSETSVLKVGKATPAKGLAAKIVELLSIRPASLTMSLVGEPAAMIAIIALMKARSDLESKGLDLLFTPDVKKTPPLEDGRILEVMNLSVINTEFTGKKRVKKEVKAQEVAVSSSEPMISVPVREWETLRQQVLELAQQNIDLTKIITAQIKRQQE